MNTKKCGGKVKRTRFVKSLADGGFLDFLSPKDTSLYENLIQDKTPEEIKGIRGMFRKKQLGDFAEATTTSQGSGVDDMISSGVMALGPYGAAIGGAYKVGKALYTGINEKRKAEEEKLAETQRENTARFIARKETEAFKSGGDVRKKPGGSNVGKYPGERTIGPSGGAPAGSYPITKDGKLNEGRGRAALAYARHAPNPAGIKAAVYRAFPSWKDKKGYSGGFVGEMAKGGALTKVSKTIEKGTLNAAAAAAGMSKSEFCAQPGLSTINKRRCALWRTFNKYRPGKQEGGVIKGKGTGTSDSIKAKLREGDFIVPYTTPHPEVADALIKALGIKHNAPLKDGYLDVSVSDGEIIIPANRIDEANRMLSRKGMTLDDLAPKAESKLKEKEREFSDGGTVTYEGETFEWDQKRKLYVGKFYAFDKEGNKFGVRQGKVVESSKGFEPDKTTWRGMDKEKLAAVYAQNRPATTMRKVWKGTKEVGKWTGEHVGEVAGTAQVIDALLKIRKLEERPDRVISKELAEISKETAQKAEYGLEPGIKSKAERDIERKRREALYAATSSGMGSSGATLAAQIAAGIGTQENLATLAGIDQTAKERKERLAQAVKMRVGERRDVIREGEIERYDKMEGVLSEELLAGIGNIVGAQRYRQFLEQKSERDKLYGDLRKL